MAYRVEWSSRAVEDLEAIAQYISLDESIREWFAYSYRIIYRVDENVVTIAAIVHGKRLLTVD
ncbi:MAG TPA: hypothetical protein VFY67_09095 [Pyrinomonadaceae bacterium]|nr:hypothetical protein [Pyrinomonadaceae bacterium]